MPTWRRWLDYRHAESKDRVKQIQKDFLKSDYYKNYLALLHKEELLDFLEKQDLRLVLYFLWICAGVFGIFSVDIE